MRQHKRWVLSPPLAAVLAAAIILTTTLFFKPVIGMADNGDFFRVMNSVGLYSFERGQSDQHYDYFTREFGVQLGYPEYEESFFSSQIPIIRIAIALDQLFTGSDGVFDIRFFGALIAILALCSFYQIVDWAAYGRSHKEGYLIAALAVFLFADTAYVAYFNSFFAEGLVMVSFLGCMASALLMEQHRYHPYWLLGIFMWNGLVLTCAKQQNAPLGILLGILGVLLAIRYKRYETNLLALQRTSLDQHPATDPMADPTAEPAHPEFGFWAQQQQKLHQISAHLNQKRHHVPWREADGQAPSRRWFPRVTVIASVLLAFVGVGTYLLIPTEFVNINQYHAMTRGILMTSDHPEQALDWFGINRQFSVLDGTIYFDRYPPVDVEGKELHKEFYPHYGFATISLYYLSHPGQLLQMLDHAAYSVNSIRPQALGNYERDAGHPPGTKSNGFALYSNFKEKFLPRKVGFMFIWMGVVLAVGLKDRWRTTVLVTAILMGLSQVGVSIIGAGDADLAKHVFLYNVSFDFVNFALLSTMLIPALVKRKKPSGSPAAKRKRGKDMQTRNEGGTA